MAQPRTLYILWTTADPQTARYMALMYATNALLNRWWEQVTVILWGASQGLAARDLEVQAAMRAASNTGVHFAACSTCAQQLDVVEELESLGVEVRPWGETITELLQSGKPLLTV